ncbi:MAG: outer membrane beta-barrel protein [Elusimicrobia bacterium]|nr:outer membrane beta-barrel protein [Elusimicrobiota bacterium]
MRKLTLAACLCLLVPKAHAASKYFDWITQYKQPNMHLGQLALHPYYQLTEMYDSNIYLVPRDQPNGVTVGGGHRESWVTKNDLGLEVELPWRRLHKLNLGYDVVFENYTTQPSINDAINQSAHADYAYSGAYGLTFKAGDRFINTNDQAFSELISRNKRWSNRGYTSLDYNPEGGRFAGGVDGFQQNDKYLNDVFASVLNRYEQEVGFNVGYKVQPKTKAYASYHRGVIHYSVPTPVGSFDKNSRSHSIGLGVTGSLAPKVEGTVEGGYMYREYDIAAVNATSRIKHLPTVATSVTYAPDPYTTVKLDLARYPEETIDPANQFYIANDAVLDVRHRFPRKFKAGIKLAFSVDKYENNQAGGPQAIRRDDLYQTGAWIEYDIQQWVYTGIAYLYRQRNSTNTGFFNFEDNQVAWNATLKF